MVRSTGDGQAEAAGTDFSGTPEQQAAIDVFNDKLLSKGYWVFAGGLDQKSNATTVDNRGETPVITDGPYTESMEFVAGFWIVEAADLDVALALATESSGPAAARSRCVCSCKREHGCGARGDHPHPGEDQGLEHPVSDTAFHPRLRGAAHAVCRPAPSSTPNRYSACLLECS